MLGSDTDGQATAAWWPLIKPRKESVIPGMVASPVSVDDGYSMGDDIQWGAGQDSFYEVYPLPYGVNSSTL